MSPTIISWPVGMIIEGGALKPTVLFRAGGSSMVYAKGTFKSWYTQSIDVPPAKSVRTTKRKTPNMFMRYLLIGGAAVTRGGISYIYLILNCILSFVLDIIFCIFVLILSNHRYR